MPNASRLRVIDMPKFDTHKTTPPDSTRADDECSYRLADQSCCHALNKLRPYPCHAFCVPKLDAWLRMQYPAMDDDEILKAIAMLTAHSPDRES